MVRLTSAIGKKHFLHEKAPDAFNTVLKSINDANNNIAENNKTLTEWINNLLLEIATTNKTLLDNSAWERYILDDNENDINKEVEKHKKLHCQFYRSQQFSSYYKTLINQERPYVPAKLRQKVNESTPNYEKEFKRQQSIDAVKDEINILEERKKDGLIELNDYDKNIQQFAETLSLPNND